MQVCDLSHHPRVAAQFNAAMIPVDVVEAERIVTTDMNGSCWSMAQGRLLFRDKDLKPDSTVVRLSASLRTRQPYVKFRRLLIRELDDNGLGSFEKLNLHGSLRR